MLFYLSYRYTCGVRQDADLAVTGYTVACGGVPGRLIHLHRASGRRPIYFSSRIIHV